MSDVAPTRHPLPHGIRRGAPDVDGTLLGRRITADHLRCEPAAIATVGDAENHVLMFELSGRGVAVGPASDPVVDAGSLHPVEELAGFLTWLAGTAPPRPHAQRSLGA